MSRLFLFLQLIALTASETGFKFIDDWYLFESHDLGFQITFPQEPTESSQLIDTDAGVLKLHIFMFDASTFDDANLNYGMFFYHYPDSLIDLNTDESINNFFRAFIDGG